MFPIVFTSNHSKSWLILFKKCFIQLSLSLPISVDINLGRRLLSSLKQHFKTFLFNVLIFLSQNYGFVLFPFKIFTDKNYSNRSTDISHSDIKKKNPPMHDSNHLIEKEFILHRSIILGCNSRHFKP